MRGGQPGISLRSIRAKAAAHVDGNAAVLWIARIRVT